MSSTMRCPRCGSDAVICQENVEVHFHACFDCDLFDWYRCRSRRRKHWEGVIAAEKARLRQLSGQQP